MRELYLLRHAHAGNPARWDGPDAARPLSSKGLRQAERLGALLAGAGLAPDRIATSPLVRAVQTAEIIARALGLELHTDERLAGPLGIVELAAFLLDAGDPSTPLLVGHDPDLSDLASDLVGAPIELRKGALARIDLPDGLQAGGGVLRWLVPPEMLGS